MDNPICCTTAHRDTLPMQIVSDECELQPSCRPPKGYHPVTESCLTGCLGKMKCNAHGQVHLRGSKKLGSTDPDTKTNGTLTEHPTNPWLIQSREMYSE